MSVYTTVTANDLNQLLLQYNIGELLHFSAVVAGVENTNYFVNTSKGQFVLTLYEHYSPTELPFFLELMQHLSNYKVETVTPVKDKRGNVLRQICAKPMAIFERLVGTALTPDEVTQQHCELIGDALARFHLAGLSYQGQRPHERDGDFSEDSTTAIAALLSVEDRQLLQEELSFQQTMPLWDELPSGITHSDLFCDNTIFDNVEGQLVLSGIIDLYFSCNDAFIYDLAVVAGDWCCDQDGSLDSTRWMSLLSAYHKVRQLETIEKQAWVDMLRTCYLRFWILRLKLQLAPREGELVLEKDPNEFKIKLQACLRDQEAINDEIRHLT
ncbi:MAG: homoserine kinase [Cocleimonas sp.]|nr:homoserine kinase [Cocleimonas sp.]